MIELNEHTHIHTIWFASDGQSDWMGCLSKKDGKPWLFQYRFRYYEDSQAFDSQDRKSYYSAQARPEMGDDEARDRFLNGVIKELLPLIESRYGMLDSLVLDRQGDDPSIFFEMASKDWMHIKFGDEAEKHLLSQDKPHGTAE